MYTVIAVWKLVSYTWEETGVQPPYAGIGRLDID